MIVTTNCWLNQNWIDHKLKWDPSLFNNIQAVHIPAEKIWKPDILLGKILKLSYLIKDDV